MRSLSRIVILVVALMTTGFGQVTTSWYRADVDYLGTKYWIAGMNEVGDHLVVHDFVMYPGWQGSETYIGFDIGLLQPTKSGFTFAELVGFDFNTYGATVDYFVPQAFVFYSSPKLYGENWFMYNHKLNDNPDILNTFVYGKNYLRYQPSGTWGIGPHFEYLYDVEVKSLLSEQYGAIIGGSYGANLAVEIYVGVDVADSNTKVGRVTFTRNLLP